MDDVDWAAGYGPGVRAHLDYPAQSVLDAFEAAVRARHGAACTDFLGRTRSFDEIEAEVTRVAGGLAARGVRRGDRVAIVLPTCPQSLIALLATFRLGAQAVLHNPLYTAEELEPQLTEHGARVAVVWDSAVPMLAPLREQTPLEHLIAVDLTRELPPTTRFALRLPLPKARKARRRLTTPVTEPGVASWESLRATPVPTTHDRAIPEQATPDQGAAGHDGGRPLPGDIAVILYTSGTTGAAKGVPLTHANLLANCRQGVEWAGLAFGSEVFLCALPMFHALGLTVGVLVGVVNGCLVELVPTPDPQLMLDAVKRRTPTFITGVPPLFEALLERAEATHTSLQGIRTSLSGAMSLPAPFVQRWEAATGGYLIEGYGLTECSPIVIGNPICDTRRPGTIGVPFPDTQVRIVSLEDPRVTVASGQEGQLLVRGPQVFGGYLDRPQDTAEAFVDGWLRTGDIVRVEDGYLVVTGRLKELIVTGGFNVSPAEVEDVLRRHPAIDEVAVVGLPSSSGESVVAAVVSREPLPPEAELRAWAKQHLAAYKVPRRFHRVDTLPVNLLGKVVRREVGPMLAAAEARRERR